MMEDLETAYDEVDLRVIGRTMESHYSPVDMLAVAIHPRKMVARSVIFAAGHHCFEEAGSESVYHIVRNLLETRRKGDTRIERLLDSTLVMGIPQVNANWYNSPFVARRKRGETLSHDEVYRSYYDIHDYSQQRVDHVNKLKKRSPETWGTTPEALLPEVVNMMKCIGGVQEVAPVEIAFDFHETACTDGGFLAEEYHRCEVKGFTFVFPRIQKEIQDVVGESYPVISSDPTSYERHLEQLERKDVNELAVIQSGSRWSFPTYMRLCGARSFLTETPFEQPLSDRIGMNLRVVEQVLLDWDSIVQ